MAYTTINKHTAYQNTVLYSGTGSSLGVTGVGHQPDMVWIKARNNTEDHCMFDSVRGGSKRISPNQATAEWDSATNITSFDSNGFTASTNSQINTNGANHVAWCWKAGTTGSGSTTGGGTSKTYNYSVDTTAGFSIVTYTGNGNSGHTIPHHLGTTPRLIIAKETGASDYWRVYHPDLSNNYNLYLNTNHAQDSAGDGYLAKGNIGSTTFGFGGASNTNTVNQDGITYVAYCWAEKSGYSKFGTYIGNGNADGAFQYLGFRPAWLMIKKFTSTDHWVLFDKERGYNSDNELLLPSDARVEEDGASYGVDLVSNGFKCRTTDGWTNTTGQEYVYMAFGQTLVGTNNVPATAR